MVAAALADLDGNVSAVARRFGVTRGAVEQLIAKNELLQQVVRDAREGLLDEAESALNRAVKEGAAWAICFFLKTQGRCRGYIERQDINQTTQVVTTAEALTDEELAAIAAGGKPGGKRQRGSN